MIKMEMEMTLKDYIGPYQKVTNKSRKDIAKELGISESYLSQLISRDKKPGADLCIRISIWSNAQLDFKTMRSV